MAAPGISLANPSGQTQDGLSGMLARIRERASRRRGELNVEPGELTPLAAMSDTDSLQAANFTPGGESPIAAAVGASSGASGGGGGGNPFRLASMTEDDEVGVTEVSDGQGEMVCDEYGCRRIQPDMSSMGLPPGAQIISERTVTQGQPVMGMPAGVVGDGTAPMVRPNAYPSDELKKLDDEYGGKPNPTTTDRIKYLTQRSDILAKASLAPGLTNVERLALGQQAAHFGREATGLGRDNEVITASKEKIAAEQAKAERESPVGRMREIRRVISDPDNPLNHWGMEPPLRAKILANMIRQDLADQRSPVQMTPDEQFQQEEMFTRWAVASDIARLVTIAHHNKENALQPTTDTQAKRYAYGYYGSLNPQARQDAVLQELQPAIAASLISYETQQLRKTTGNPGAELRLEDVYKIEQLATGHTAALLTDMNSFAGEGSRDTILLAPPKAPPTPAIPKAPPVQQGDSVLAPQYGEPSGRAGTGGWTPLKSSHPWDD